MTPVVKFLGAAGGLSFLGQGAAPRVQLTGATDSFRPADYGLTPRVWLDAGQESFTNNSTVATATDRSGNSIVVTQATAGKRPIYKTGIVGGRAAFRFDDADDGWSGTLTGLTGTRPWVVVVMRSRDETWRQNAAPFEHGGPDNTTRMNAWFAQSTKAFGVAQGTLWADGAAVGDNRTLSSINAWIILSYRVPMAASLDAFVIGTWENNAAFAFYGDIAEIIVSSTAPSDTAALHAALAAKYSRSAQSTFTLTPSQLWDNDVTNAASRTDGALSYYSSSSMARALFTTTAQNAVITIHSDSAMKSYFVGVRSGGADVDYGTTDPYIGRGQIAVNMPPGSKTVEIVAGNQGTVSGSTVGVYLVDITFDAPATLLTPVSTPRILIYGDSISVGVGADVPALQAWTVLLRQYYSGSIILEGYGGRQLRDDCVDAAARAAFVTKIAALAPNVIYLAIGTNDYGFANWNAAAFGVAYENLLSRLHTALPSAQIIAESPLIRGGYTSNNALGDAMTAYTAQIVSACSGKAYVTYVNGLPILTLADMPSDQLHPNTAGHATKAAAARATLGI